MACFCETGRRGFDEETAFLVFRLIPSFIILPILLEINFSFAFICEIPSKFLLILLPDPVFLLWKRRRLSWKQGFFCLLARLVSYEDLPYSLLRFVSTFSFRQPFDYFLLGNGSGLTGA